MYYSWLKEGKCSVSAILLDSGIDTGRILEICDFPPPPENIDPDLVYDNAIRAATMIKVLSTQIAVSEVAGITQEQVTMPYYKIHPVLKHLAILSNR